jgi:hypothetical protein
MIVDKVFHDIHSKSNNYVIFESTFDASFQIRLDGTIRRVEKHKNLAIFKILDTNIQFAVFLDSEMGEPKVEINFNDRQNGFLVFRISKSVFNQFFKKANNLK